MKKVTTLFSAVLFALFGFVSVQAQTILEEDLRGDAVPAEWSETDMDFRTSAGGYALFEAETSTLTSPSFDLSDYTENVSLTFFVATFGSGTHGPLTAEVSIDGGTTWDAQSFDSPTPSGSSPYTEATMEFDSSVIGESDVQVRFSRPNSAAQLRLRDVAVIGPDGITIPEAIEVTTIDELRDGETDGETRYKLTGEAVINFYDSYQNRRYLADTSAAIFSVDPNGNLADADTIGVGITSLSGTLSLENNGALVQFTLDAQNADSASITSTDNNPMPTTTTISDLSLEETGSLVRINGVSFQETGAFETGTNYTLEDANGNTLTFRTDFFNADYIDEAIPEGSLDVVGVVGGYGSSPQIFARSSADFLETFEVTFQADLSDMIDSAAFVPGEDFITIPGSMNDWSTSADTLTDADEDGIYTKTLTLAPSDQSYKFHIYSNTGRISGGYEANQETDNTNRNFTVDSDTTLDAEQPDFEFRDLNDAVFGEVELYFQVDMSIQELNGNFDPASDEYVSVTGAFEQDWSATAYPLTETQEDGIYEGTVTFSTEKAIPSTFAYKFTIVNADESVSWESGDDKLITVTEDSEFEGVYLAQNAPEGNIPYFDNITPSDVFTEDTEVVFEVDLRAAYYHLADSASLPADVQTGTGADSTISWLYGNGPLLANGWEDWGVSESDAEAAGLVFNDSGENGDEVEGDSLYSATFSYVAGDARVGAFKMGVNGQDNEAGFGADHSVRINDANRIEVVFGAFVRADTVYDDLYDEYILATEEGPVVVRNGGSGDDGVIVSNEEEAIESPQEFELSQNYPNPFNPTTNINFTLPQATNVSLTVYNVLGQQVARLVNGRLAAGQHSVQFDASNLASGMYLYRIEAGTFTQNKKMMLIK